jgi:hypothetical protein
LNKRRVGLFEGTTRSVSWVPRHRRQWWIPPPSGGHPARTAGFSGGGRSTNPSFREWWESRDQSEFFASDFIEFFESEFLQ